MSELTLATRGYRLPICGKFSHGGKANRNWRKAVKMARREIAAPDAPAGKGWLILHSRKMGGPAIFETWTFPLVDEAGRFGTPMVASMKNVFRVGRKPLSRPYKCSMSLAAGVDLGCTVPPL